MTSHLMNAYNRADLAVSHGMGMYLFDRSGRKYLDFLGGVAVNSLGHCHPAMVSAIERQARKLWHASNLLTIPEQETLARRLCENSFADAVFFGNSGAEAVDFALKLVRRYAKTTDRPGRWRTITMEHGFHGRSMAAIAAGGQAKLVQGYEPVVEGFDCVPFGDVDAVRKAITPETAAILLEPIQGEGGVRVASDDYMRALRGLADEHGLLLVLDEMQSGMGRTGKLMAHEWSGVTPDIVAIGKGLGAGYPMAATLTTASVAHSIQPGSHGSTLGGAPLAMAVGHAVLDVVLQPGFLGGVLERAERLRMALVELTTASDTYEDVRGRGLLLGLRCRPDNRKVMATLAANGLLVGPAGDNVIRILPPLIAEPVHFDEALRILKQTDDQLSEKGLSA